MARSASDTVKGVQTLLRHNGNPTLVVDGIVGVKTTSAYRASASWLKTVIDDYVTANGFTSTGLLSPVRSQPSSHRISTYQGFGTVIKSSQQKREWLESLIPLARAEQKRSGLSASLMLAQAVLESNWGQSELAQTAKNLFGIKADSSWRGKSINRQTREVYDGQSVVVPDNWRVYGSYKESFEDRTSFLRSNPRYKRAGLFDDDVLGYPIQEANALHRAGYATDPSYVKRLLDVMKGATFRSALTSQGMELDSKMRLRAA